MDDNFPTDVGSLVADAWPVVTQMYLGVPAPGGSMIGQAINRVLKRKIETARDILLEEMRSGTARPPEAAHFDEFCGILYRYSRAATEGSARLSLRLLAKIIAGQAHRGDFVADEFLSYADRLSSLRRPEIIALGIIYKIANLPEADLQGAEGFNVAVARRQLIQNELVPVVFDSLERLEATLGSLTRTGFISVTHVMGGAFSRPSPMLEDLNKLASLEAVLRAEERKV